jgi:hypothetical protein
MEIFLGLLLLMPIGLMWYGVWYFGFKGKDKIAFIIYIFVPLSIMAIVYGGLIVYGLALLLRELARRVL